MNSLNRFLVSLGGAALIGAGVYVLLLVSGAVGPRDLDGELFVPLAGGVAADTGARLWTDVDAAFSLVASGIAADTGGDRWVDVGIAIALIAAGVLILTAMALSALAGVRRRSATVLLRADEEGSVRVSVESIRQLTERTGSGVRSVRDCRGSVRIDPGGLRLHCELTLHMAANVPDVTAEVQETVREVIERLTGFKVIDVSVRARYARERDEPVRAR